MVKVQVEETIYLLKVNNIGIIGKDFSLIRKNSTIVRCDELQQM